MTERGRYEIARAVKIDGEKRLAGLPRTAGWLVAPLMPSENQGRLNSLLRTHLA